MSLHHIDMRPSMYHYFIICIAFIASRLSLDKLNIQIHNPSTDRGVDTPFSCLHLLNRVVRLIFIIFCFALIS